MTKTINCFSCKKVSPFQSKNKCPSCGSLNVETISKERLVEGLESGVFFNIDPITGKPAKKK